MPPSRSHWYTKAAIVILLIVLVILCVFLVRQYDIIVRQGTISSERTHFADLVRQHPLTAADAGLIQPWMTFNYIAVSYRVPISYLTITADLASTTPGYPNITLNHYAKLRTASVESFDPNASPEEVVKNVQDAVRSYDAPISNP